MKAAPTSLSLSFFLSVMNLIAYLPEIVFLIRNSISTRANQQIKNINRTLTTRSINADICHHQNKVSISKMHIHNLNHITLVLYPALSYRAEKRRRETTLYTKKGTALNIFHLIVLFCFMVIISHYNDLEFIQSLLISYELCLSSHNFPVVVLFLFVGLSPLPYPSLLSLGGLCIQIATLWNMFEKVLSRSRAPWRCSR